VELQFFEAVRRVRDKWPLGKKDNIATCTGFEN
jgi:hypothetical protein